MGERVTPPAKIEHPLSATALKVMTVPCVKPQVSYFCLDISLLDNLRWHHVKFSQLSNN